MRVLIVCAALLAAPAAGGSKDGDLVYEGTWVTTNRPLEVLTARGFTCGE